MTTPTDHAALVERVRKKNDWLLSVIPDVMSVQAKRKFLMMFQVNVRALCDAVEKHPEELRQAALVEREIERKYAKGSGESSRTFVPTPSSVDAIEGSGESNAGGVCHPDCIEGECHPSCQNAQPDPAPGDSLVGELRELATRLSYHRDPMNVRRAAAEIERLTEQGQQFKDMCFAQDVGMGINIRIVERERKRAERAEAHLEQVKEGNQGNYTRANKAERERDALKSKCDELKGWKREFEMYRRAWIRELGGSIVRKTHEIDGLVLTTREMRRSEVKLPGVERERDELRRVCGLLQHMLSPIRPKFKDDQSVLDRVGDKLRALAEVGE